jgi:hypothetical protein
MSKPQRVDELHGIAPPWTNCPNCGHHEMSHRHTEGEFICIVFECPCPNDPEESE